MYLLDAFAALVAFYLLYRLRKRAPSLPLPPGPKGLPFVGNAFMIPKSFEWITYHKWSEELETDILHLDMMGQNVIVLDKIGVASALLEKRSSLYSSRPTFRFLDELVGIDFAVGAMKYGDNWRHHRRLAHSFFALAAAANYRPHNIRAARNLMGRLLDNPKDIKEQIQYMAGDAIMSICYGLDVRTKDGTYYLSAVRQGIQAFIEAMIPGKFMVEFLPFLIYVPEWMPGAGFQTKAREWKRNMEDMVKLPFSAAQKNMDTGNCPPCFSCKYVHGVESDFKGLDPAEVTQNVAGTMFVAGADTTVSTISSCILGLLSRPDVLRRARADLDRVIEPGRLPDFDDQPALPFITAIAKEALRWREVTPLGLPHCIDTDDEYAGYRIPAGSIILVNQWALLHDEELYPEPFLFKPERFMNGDQYNYETKDPEFACWGFGRRICPGRFMAYSAIWITIASLIYAFDIERELDEHGSPVETDPHYSSGLIFAPDEVPCRITPRSAEFAKLIRDSIGQDS